MLTTLLIMPVVLLSMYSVGGLIWMHRLHRKFNIYLQMGRLAQVKCAKAGYPVSHAFLEEAEHAIRAMEAEQADFRKIPLWPIKLRNRWNADYWQETA